MPNMICYYTRTLVYIDIWLYYICCR